MTKVQRGTTIWLLLQLIGSVCLLFVVLTHVAESLDIFPAMGWGQPNSTGHYLDLVSAILAAALLPLGFIGAFIRSKNPK
jgi:preprotein translocase subunit SecG